METSVSLLERLCTLPDDRSWKRLDDLYRPLIRSWLLREPYLGSDVDDLVQEVMMVLVRKVPGFRRQRNGSFRCWLRKITTNQLRTHRRGHQRKAGRVTSLDGWTLADQLADPHSEASRQWDEEHDRYVVRRLLELIEDHFEADAVEAFRRVMFDEEKPVQVAADLGMSINTVYLAKSRILKWLRQESDGLLG